MQKQGKARILLRLLLPVEERKLIATCSGFVTRLNAKEARKICLYYFSHGSVQTAAYETSVFRIVRELIDEAPARGKRFFDLVLAATLKYHGLRRFYTRNDKHFRSYSFPKVINPLQTD